MLAFHPLFKNSHLATVAANFWSRPESENTWPVSDTVYESEPGVGVLVRTQTPKTPIGQIVLVHGLEGSSESGYVRSMAHAALHFGFAVHRFNMRGCGGSPLHPKGNYHSGQTADLLHLAKTLRAQSSLPLYAVGYSLGGNVVLKLAGELGDTGQNIFAGVCSVSAPIDLAACARKTTEPMNYFYQRRFVERLKERVRERNPMAPQIFPLEPLPRVRTIQDFDEYYTARIFGFGDAANYYRTQSSQNFLPHIRIPTLLIQAKDDPLIPFSTYNQPALATNQHLHLLASEHGGHLGFLARGAPRFWLDHVLMDWLTNSGASVAGFRSSR